MIRGGFTTRTIIGVIAGCLWWTCAYAQAIDQVTYYHTDAVGSVRMVTDATGQVVQRHDYLPFGEEWGAQPQNRRMFAGDERDQETGFDYFGARYFASGNGRFTTPDDPSYMDPFNPQSMNRYAYVYNNPLRFVDSTGHSGDCVYGYDSRTGLCTGGGLDTGTLRFFLESLARNFDAATQEFAQRFSRPVDQRCLAGSVGIGASIGGVAGGVLGGAGGGAGGAFGGTLVAPGVGTLGGGFAGGATGFAQGTAFGVLAGGTVGGAVGSVACMGDTGGGSGGGQAGGGQGSFWEQLKPFRGKTKTNGLSGGARRFFERDYTHGDIEVYDARGRHLGSANPETGAMTKPPVPGRRIGI